jgi:hypothetical protein
MNYADYTARHNDISRAFNEGRIDAATANDLKKQAAEGAFDSSADLGQFETLLGKLEGSKMRQQRQKSVEGRRDIYGQGLAQMMSNF